MGHRRRPPHGSPADRPVHVLEDAGAQSVTGWATALSTGPADESGQALHFTVTTDHPEFFSSAPAIGSTGVSIAALLAPGLNDTYDLRLYSPAGFDPTFYVWRDVYTAGAFVRTEYATPTISGAPSTWTRCP